MHKFYKIERLSKSFDFLNCKKYIASVNQISKNNITKPNFNNRNGERTDDTSDPNPICYKYELTASAHAEADLSTAL